jgi:hypothetical protein
VNLKSPDEKATRHNLSPEDKHEVTREKAIRHGSSPDDFPSPGE